MCDTTTLLAMGCNILPISIGLKPEFLSSGINLHTSNASNEDNRSFVVESFFMTSVNVIHKSYQAVPN